MVNWRVTNGDRNRSGKRQELTELKRGRWVQDPTDAQTKAITMVPGDLRTTAEVVTSVSQEVVLLSFCILFVLTITFLALCADCTRHSFHMRERPKKKTTPSILIRVVNLDEARQSPWINNITKDEKDDSSEPTKMVNSNAKERREAKLSSTDVSTDKVNEILSKELHSQNESTLSRDGTRAAAESPENVTVQTNVAYRLVINSRLEVESPLQSAPSQILSHIHSGAFHSSHQSSEHRETNFSQNPSRSQHTYESMEELSEVAINPYPPPGPVVEGNFEEPGYQTVKELTSDSSSAKHVFEVQWGQDAPLSIPSTPPGVVEEGLDSMGLNEIYTQVNKKVKCPTQQVPQPKDKEIEEEELPPPVPDRSSEDSFVTVELA
ncbi:hypothetical protein GN956_G18393 [Arapaima gigas]